MLLFPIETLESGCKDFTTFGKILLKRYKIFATQDVQKSRNLCVLYFFSYSPLMFFNQLVLVLVNIKLSRN